MERTSIDGRPTKKSNKQQPVMTTPSTNISTSPRMAATAATAAATAAAKAHLAAHLRPASPPKTNPWSCQKAIEHRLDNASFPALPEQQQAPPRQPPPMTTITASTSKRRLNRVTTEAPPTPATSSEPSPVPESASIHVEYNNRASSNKDALARSVSTSSTASSSRHALEAAAPRATEKFVLPRRFPEKLIAMTDDMDSLWLCPFGADVVVHTMTMSFRVHHSILVESKSWFSDNLPPPNPDGSPVEIAVSCDVSEAVAHCLRYIYTERIEICEYNKSRPWNLVHLPRCVLAYTAAVTFRLTRLASHLLRIIDDTAASLESLVTAKEPHRPLNNAEWFEFSWHFQSALEMLYRHTPEELMMPMRLAMAGIFDSIWFWLLRQPVFMGLLRTTWQYILPRLSLDQAKYRRRLSELSSCRSAAMHSEADLAELFLEHEQR